MKLLFQCFYLKLIFTMDYCFAFEKLRNKQPHLQRTARQTSASDRHTREFSQSKFVPHQERNWCRCAPKHIGLARACSSQNASQCIKNDTRQCHTAPAQAVWSTCIYESYWYHELNDQSWTLRNVHIECTRFVALTFARRSRTVSVGAFDPRERTCNQVWAVVIGCSTFT